MSGRGMEIPKGNTPTIRETCKFLRMPLRTEPFVIPVVMLMASWHCR